MSQTSSGIIKHILQINGVTRYTVVFIPVRKLYLASILLQDVNYQPTLNRIMKQLTEFGFEVVSLKAKNTRNGTLIKMLLKQMPPSVLVNMKKHNRRENEEDEYGEEE